MDQLQGAGHESRNSPASDWDQALFIERARYFQNFRQAEDAYYERTGGCASRASGLWQLGKYICQHPEGAAQVVKGLGYLATGATLVAGGAGLASLPSLVSVEGAGAVATRALVAGTVSAGADVATQAALTGDVNGWQALGAFAVGAATGPKVTARAPNKTGAARFVAGSDGVITDLGPRVAPGRPVVIGENMSGRVIPDAQRMGADFYGPPRFDNPAQSMAHNRYWINEQMNQGRGIIDVGPAPGRAGFPEPTSPWYTMERAQIADRDYPWYVQRQQL